MSRARGISGVAAGTVGVLLLAGGTLVVPRIAAEQRRAAEAARAMAVAMVPADVVDDARVETRPTAYGWRVVFHDVQVRCSQTKFTCASGEGVASSLGPNQVFPDLLVCVEYGTGRGYFVAATTRPVAASSWRDAAGEGCVRSQLPARLSTT